jgi:hypothetical protein
MLIDCGASLHLFHSEMRKYAVIWLELRASGTYAPAAW